MVAKIVGECHSEAMSNAAQKLDPDDDVEMARLRAAVEESRAAERCGEVVPHQRVREWLLALAEGKRSSAPRP